MELQWDGEAASVRRPCGANCLNPHSSPPGRGERVSCPSALVLGWISGFLGQLGAAGEAPGGVLPMSHPRTYSKFTASSCQL